jgi:protein O-mannosyl-transferase
MSGGTTALRPGNAAGAGSSPRWSTILGGVIIVLAAMAAYHNCFRVPFLLDDVRSVIENPTIRHLWPLWGPLSPPSKLTVEGRPVVNLTLAINYALGGVMPWGYHALNLAIHILAGLMLFGVVRRTLLQPGLRDRFGVAANRLAPAIAVIWTVHPLQTEAVTYVSQRAESLMGLFYLLTMYCFIRGVESGKSVRWYALSVTACLLGMGTKEVMVSAPLMVLLYDWMFVAGSLRKAWARRWRLYVGLAGTWILLGYLVANASSRGGSAGFGTEMSWWPYALTQCRAVVHYLKLSVWPHPLVFDYGTATVKHVGQALPYALLLAALAAGTVIALCRRQAIGFLGVWFFAILAPSSSVVPVVTQTIAEHRMYLSLAAVVTLGVMAINALLGRYSGAVFLALALGFGLLTAQRNEDYRTELSIWNDTVAKRPDNARAHNNLGLALQQAGRTQDAVEHYEQALQIKPDYADAHYNLGIVFFREGKLSDAIGHFEEALRISPDYAKAHYNLGIVFMQEGKLTDAIGHFEQALRIDPDYAKAHANLGTALARLGKNEEAATQFEQALRINPDLIEPLNNLAWLLATLPPTHGGNAVRAVNLAQRACELSGNRAPNELNTLAAAYAAAGRFDAAVATAQRAVDLARSAGQAELAKQIESRLELYRSGHADSQPAKATSPSNP